MLFSACAVIQAGCDDRSADFSQPIQKIILISLDTLRPDHLGTYGYHRETSPRIDELAQQGFVFDRALASAPNTPPSQMSMMTSLYPGRHGFTGQGDKLAPGVETLAQRLHAAGLQTAGFVDGGYLHAVFGFGRGFDTYNDKGGGFAKILPRALRWLDAHDEEPFFLFLHSYDIHAPYISPPPFRGMFHEQPYAGGLVPTVEQMDLLFASQTKLGAAEMQHLVDSYDEGIRYTDTEIGRLLDHLEERGRLEDTLVILTSDHGEEFGEHGSVIHWQLYFQPNLRVPLIVRPPGGLAGPLRLADQAELIDILPTLLELAGTAPLAAAQGRSLVPMMTAIQTGGRTPSAPDQGDRIALGWWPNPEQLPLRSIIVGDYQLIFDDQTPGMDQLYDLKTDPMAQRDLAGKEPDVAARLRNLGLRGMRENQPDPSTRTGTTLHLEPETRDQLRALGYDR